MVQNIKRPWIIGDYARKILHTNYPNLNDLDFIQNIILPIELAVDLGIVNPVNDVIVARTIGVHFEHCCSVHQWCKYMDDDCPTFFVKWWVKHPVYLCLGCEREENC